MNLLTIENLSTLQKYKILLGSNKCKIITIFAVKTNNISELNRRMSYWTSASSEGQHCALERTYAWCTTGAIFEGSFINDMEL